MQQRREEERLQTAGQRLKVDYIKKFGGWSEIDLDHTTYDGHK